MAAVTRVKARPVSPPGYEVNDKGYIAGACTTGDLLVQDGAAAVPYGYEMVWVKAPITGITEAQGVALMDVGTAGGTVSVGVHGEMDGFSGMTRGAPLYPSVATVGGLDTTAIAGATVRIRALTATRIRYAFV